MSTENAAGARRVIHFRDPLPPQEIQFGLERKLRALFVPASADGHIAFRATAKTGAIEYVAVLTLEAALPFANALRLELEGRWERPVEDHDSMRREAGGWFDYWTMGLAPAPPPTAGEDVAERYQQVAGEWLAAESHLATVEAIQQEILAAMQQGATFSTSHKEGGTNMSYRSSHYLTEDYGESDNWQRFADPQKFLAYLRQFYDWETSRSVWPAKVSDYEAWKLILRFLQRKR